MLSKAPKSPPNASFNPFKLSSVVFNPSFFAVCFSAIDNSSALVIAAFVAPSLSTNKLSALSFNPILDVPYLFIFSLIPFNGTDSPTYALASFTPLVKNLATSVLAPAFNKPPTIGKAAAKPPSTNKLLAKALAYFCATLSLGFTFNLSNILPKVPIFFPCSSDTSSLT